MPRLLIVLLIFAIAYPASAQELGIWRSVEKDNAHVLMNPGQPDGREGGETFATAFEIPGIPFSDSGNTSDNYDDYDASCPYEGSTSPDVVYSYTPSSDLFVQVDLLGSLYDTKTYIMDGAMNVIACNDDFYPDYVSMIESVELLGGNEYFIVIDGYGGDGGDYQLEVRDYIPPEPCIIEPTGWNREFEPPLGPGYVDEWNSGCGGIGTPFFVINGGYCGGPSEIDFYGTSGWPGPDERDTDWYIVYMGEYGSLTWTVNSEQEAYAFELGPQNCDSVGVIQSMLITPCEPQTMTVTANPGDAVWLWVGPSEFSPPANFEGYEFDYHCHFDGLYYFAGVTPTEQTTMDKIKSMYR